MTPHLHTKENHPASFLEFDSISPANVIWNCFLGIPLVVFILRRILRLDEYYVLKITTTVEKREDE